MTTIYNGSYSGSDKLREYNIFEEEYYTSSDIKIEANGVTINQISAIQYELSEQLKPIYGYASNTYDDIAVGSRIVTGSFICPIKNSSDTKEFVCNASAKAAIASKNEEYSSSKQSAYSDKYIKRFYKEDLYLDPMFDNHLTVIDDCDVVVEFEGDNFYYVYLIDENKFGYIKK